MTTMDMTPTPPTTIATTFTGMPIMGMTTTATTPTTPTTIMGMATADTLRRITSRRLSPSR